MSEKKLQSAVFAAILVILFLVVCRLFAPFFTVLLWSTLLYILVSPLHRRLTRRLDFSTRKGRALKNIWAAVFALGTLALVLLPICFMGAVFFRQIMDLARYSRELFSHNPEFFRNALEKIAAFLRNMSAGQITVSAGELERQIMAFLSAGMQRLLSISGGIARNIGGFSFNIFLIAFSMFFFYVDGPYLSRLLLHSIPIRRSYLSALTAKFKDITRNLFFGYIIVALIQTVLAYIIFSVFGIRGSLALAALTFICVFVPIIGGGVVWLPIGLGMFLAGNTVRGVVFMLVSGFFISTLDNLIRPLFLRDRIQLHPLIIFFAILGGIKAFGFNGLVLGPVVVIFFLTVLDMFFTEHKLGEED